MTQYKKTQMLMDFKEYIISHLNQYPYKHIIISKYGNCFNKGSTTLLSHLEDEYLTEPKNISNIFRTYFDNEYIQIKEKSNYAGEIVFDNVLSSKLSLEFLEYTIIKFFNNYNYYHSEKRPTLKEDYGFNNLIFEFITENPETKKDKTRHLIKMIKNNRIYHLFNFFNKDITILNELLNSKLFANDIKRNSQYFLEDFLDKNHNDIEKNDEVIKLILNKCKEINNTSLIINFQQSLTKHGLELKYSEFMKINQDISELTPISNIDFSGESIFYQTNLSHIPLHLIIEHYQKHNIDVNNIFNNYRCRLVFKLNDINYYLEIKKDNSYLLFNSIFEAKDTNSSTGINNLMKEQNRFLPYLLNYLIEQFLFNKSSHFINLSNKINSFSIENIEKYPQHFKNNDALFANHIWNKYREHKLLEQHFDKKESRSKRKL